MTIDKEKLRAAAMAATQGEWCFGSFHELLVVPVKNGVPAKHDPIASLGETAIPWDSDSYSEERYNNANHIATSNPSTIISLLDALDKAETDALELKIFCNHLSDRRNELVVENASLKNEAAFWKESSKTWADQHDELAERFQGHPNNPVIERLKAELESSRTERVKDSLDATRYHTLIHNMGLVEAHATKWRPAIHKPLIQYLQDYIDDIGMVLNHEGE